MQTFNYHCHTARCGHASGEDEAYVQQAIQTGYTKIGFSDHAPYENGYQKGSRMPKSALPDYIASIRFLQEKYKAQIDIRLGLEIEYFEEQLTEIREYKQQMDFLILGQHMPSLWGKEIFDHHEDEDILRYASQVEKACAQKIPDIIAHPDIYMYGKETWTPACEEAAHRICQAAVQNDIMLEINLSGLRYGKRQLGQEERYPYPYRRFWEIAEGYQGMILYGLDAHVPEKYADKECYEIVQNEILQGLSFAFVKDVSFSPKEVIV